jgi:hypothetical protein
MGGPTEQLHACLQRIAIVNTLVGHEKIFEIISARRASKDERRPDNHD